MNKLNIKIVDGRVNPFPNCLKDEFSLGIQWFLPQHLTMLREITGNPDLQWDFSSKKGAEKSLYKSLYARGWTGNLGLLFFKEVIPFDYRVLPDYWVEHKVKGLISNEEMAQWDKVVQDMWHLQYEYFERGRRKE